MLSYDENGNLSEFEENTDIVKWQMNQLLR